MNGSEAEFSVITALFNGSEVIGDQMGALAAQEVSFPWEYVVVDNGSTDDSLEVVRARAAEFPVPVRIVDGSSRRGISYVRNLGLTAAASDLVAFCDQDDVVQAGWLQEAHRQLQNHEAAMGLIRSHADPERIINGSALTDNVIIESCTLAIRRDALQRVGGFDEELSGYGLDDAELQVRLRKAGVDVVGAPKMVILAREVPVMARVKKVFSSGKAEIYVWRKHQDIFGDRLSWRYLIGDFVSAVRDLGTSPRVPLKSRGRRLVTSIAHLAAFAQKPN